MKLIVSDLGTIKSEGIVDSEKIEETNLEVFLNDFEREIKHFYLNNEENEKGNYVNRNYGISKKGDNRYNIVYNGSLYEFTNKESFFIEKLKPDLLFIIETIKEFNKLTGLNKEIYNFL